MNRKRVLKVTGLAAALAVAAVSFGPPGPAHAAAGGQGTCTPGTIIFHGPYRVYDNAWLGKSAKRFCISSTGLNLTIDSNAVPVGGMVVAYPSIRYGRFWGDLDKPSGFPLPVPSLGGRGVVLRVSSTGRAAGAWQSDVDAWFIPSPSWTGHGTTELVIVNRSSSGASHSGTLLRIAGVRYRLVSWMTCQRLARGGCDPAVPAWRLIYLSRVRQVQRSVIHLGRTIRKLVARRLLHRNQWLGDVAYGTELWSGGKGLTDTLTVGAA